MHSIINSPLAAHLGRTTVKLTIVFDSAFSRSVFMATLRDRLKLASTVEKRSKPYVIQVTYTLNSTNNPSTLLALTSSARFLLANAAIFMFSPLLMASRTGPNSFPSPTPQPKLYRPRFLQRNHLSSWMPQTLSV